MQAIDEILDLLLPTKCVLCQRLGSAICLECAASFEQEPREVRREHLSGVAASEFDTKERQILHAFKENGQTSLVGFLAKPLTSLLLQLAEGIDHPLLVPVPSSKVNYKNRGFMPTLLLARRVCRASGQVCRVADFLSFERKVADQSHLDSSSRRTNLAGSMVADSRVAGRKVILFDDIVTTGSTILEADRAVTLAGGKVVGFFAFAETILKTQSKS